MSEILARLPDELKLDVLSFFSTYDVDKLKTNCDKNISIKNMTGQIVCYRDNEGFYNDDSEYEIIIEDEKMYNPKSENCFNICHIVYDHLRGRINDDLFTVKYLKNTYHHSNMWMISGDDGFEFEYGTMFVNDDNLIDIMKQLEVKDDVIKETLEKYKKNAK